MLSSFTERIVKEAPLFESLCYRTLSDPHFSHKNMNKKLLCPLGAEFVEM